MTLPEFSIRRHVMALMMSLVLVLFGIIGYNDIGNDRVPNVDFPIISVNTALPGADPSTVESSVTQFIERAVNTVPGIDNINSTSSPSTSVVSITFELGRDIDTAFAEVQTRVSEEIANLPDDAEAPIVEKVEADARPIMWLVLQGDRTEQQLTELARNTVRPQLEQISGVGEARLGGGRNRRIRIELDVDAMNREAVTVPEVMAALEREHVLAPGGFLVGGRQEQMLNLDLEYSDVDELAELIVARSDERLVRLRDVSDVVDGLSDYRRLARFNGEASVGLGVVKIAGANTVEIIDEVQRRLEAEIKPLLPSGVDIRISSDESIFIRSMIDNLERTLLLAVLLAALVMWLFLKSLRSTFLIAASIPVSLLAVTAVMYFAGYTLNSMTMLAILLLIGLVVDDAIVVLENIWRHREGGEKDARKAAAKGANEVYTAVIASSLSLIAIFGSVFFMEGMIGRFFESFAVVVVFGVAVSTFVALTLIPMLCSRYLSIPESHGKVYHVLEGAFQRLDNGYRRTLAFALRGRAKTLLACGALLIASGLIVTQLGGEFAPEEDEGQIVVNMRAPLGSSIEYMDEKLAQVEAILAEQDEVENFFAAIGIGGGDAVNEAISFVRLKHWDERGTSQQAVMARLNDKFADIPGVRIFTASPGMVGGQRGEPLQFFVRGPSLDDLAGVADEFLSELQAREGMGNIDMDLRLEQPELRLNVDRERALLAGLSTEEIVQTVNILIGGSDIARYDDDFGGGERFRVRMKGREDQFTRPEDINRIWLRNPGGERIRLDSVARFDAGRAPAVISRYDLQYAAPFYVSPEKNLGDAVASVNEVADQFLPGGFNIALAGQAEELGRTVNAIVFVFVVAVLLVYMVLASQFNSFLQPLIIMLAMPLAMMGAVLGLWITGNTLNIFSMIGMVLLIGVVTKNSILLIDLTNQYRRHRDMSINEALQSACPVRLRPVLMTSLTLILAMIPAAFDSGPGGQGNNALAVTIIFGMTVSTALTLLVVPAAYSLLEGVKEKRRGPA
ncbi:efflux RND transporter permease subunit [Marinimicrobium alkaliphilum]|uniref:efflux RND transporter permease subunit n=1 Tax=Marinimicrobium alkaliphilum TaxID=2202654 RepID=UPI000DB993D7|nr:efflux RND transporter permease subunit [Marinimicrobium alkaliphilum]